MASFPRFRPVPWNAVKPIAGWEIEFRKAGHILGAASLRVRASGSTAALVFSGDLGRPHDPMLDAPQPCPDADYLVVESTYGNRKHEAADPAAALLEVLHRAQAQQGVVLVPSFAVGRTQNILHMLWNLKRLGRLPSLPVFVDSPMATDVTRLYLKHAADHKLGAALAERVFGIAHYVQSPEESKSLSARKGPMILISASGMATGGRILHHLKAFAPDPANEIVLAGFQAEGTRGAQLAAGRRSIRIFGAEVPVNARVTQLPNASAHADADEAIDWMRGAARPRRTFVTHGEPVAAAALRERIVSELGRDAYVPRLGEAAELG